MLKTKKIRVSRKGVKAGPHVPIITSQWFPLGVQFPHLQVTGRAPNDGTERWVYIDCPLCGGKGKCRFRELRNGVVKSCGCLEWAADAKYQVEIDNEIYHLETRDRNAIFTDIVQLKTKEAAKKHGRSERFCNTLFYGERDRLALLPAHILLGIVRASEVGPFGDIAEHYGLTVGGILHIVRVAHRAEKAAAQAVQDRWDALGQVDQLALEALLREVPGQMDEAIANAAIKPWTEDGKGRYEGELTQQEFCLDRVTVSPKTGRKNYSPYSYFGWIPAVINLVPRAIAREILGDQVDKLMEIVDYTRMMRRERQNEVARQSKMSDEVLVKSRRPVSAKRAHGYGYFYPGRNHAATVEGLTIMNDYKKLQAAQAA